ncbi:hypothetical protein BFJ70_g16601 [Fusarium oxysporum]|nr:hypothetical protein BFJ70_g16601 [Fusarium oxysporum]
MLSGSQVGYIVLGVTAALAVGYMAYSYWRRRNQNPVTAIEELGFATLGGPPRSSQSEPSSIRSESSSQPINTLQTIPPPEPTFQMNTNPRPNSQEFDEYGLFIPTNLIVKLGERKIIFPLELADIKAKVYVNPSFGNRWGGDSGEPGTWDEFKDKKLNLKGIISHKDCRQEKLKCTAWVAEVTSDDPGGLLREFKQIVESHRHLATGK